MFAVNRSPVCLFAAFLLSVAFYVPCRSAENVVLQCDTFRYEISPSGRNIAFVDRSDGRNYAKPDAICASIQIGDKTYNASSVALDGRTLNYRFGDSGVTASVKTTVEKGRIVFEVVEVNGVADAMTFVDVPLTLEAKSYEPFAACALSLNLHTHVHQLPALHSRLWSCCYKRFGFKGAKTAVLGVPQSAILPTIRDVMTKAAPDVPFSDQGGAWALQSKEGYGSYLINHGALCEENIDDWIKLLKQTGFTQIDNHGTREIEHGASRVPKTAENPHPFFFLFGSFEMDPIRFPNGWNDYKKVVDRLHAEGVSSLLHTYTMFISIGSKYVQPIPHPDLDVLSEFTLARPIDENATEIVVRESTKDVSTEQGWIVVGNRVVRIGNEIVEFTDVTREAPYKFTGCKRGFQGTKAASHEVNARVGWLKTYWSGMYVPRPGSKLWDEIAEHTAQIVDDCGFDGVYFDAIEGVQRMWGAENYWYYGDKFVFDVMKRLKKPVGVEYAGMLHHWWHYRNRYQAWDMCSRGYKRFLDIHIASMKAGEEYQHGCWRGHWPDIKKYGAMKDGGLYLPLQLGWWALHANAYPTMENMFSDDIEYIGCKMIGNNAGFSFIGGIDAAAQKAHPVWTEYLETLRRYETLRKSDYFGEEIRAKLRVPGDEFRLCRDGDRWYFKPVFFDRHKCEGVTGSSASWTVKNSYRTQPATLRIEALYSMYPYNDSSAMTVLDATTCKELKRGDTAEGVTATAAALDEKVPATGEPVFEITARASGRVPRDSSWVKLARTFETPLDFKGRLGLGCWICGDGSGAVLDLRPFSGDGFASFRSSHFVKLDFSGWRFVTLLESESTAISDYRWPVSGGYHVYDHYGGNARFNAVREMQLWLNNLPADRPCKVKIGPIKALVVKSMKMKNPCLTFNGREKIVFPVEMTSGMYIEYRGENNCRLMSAAGVTQKTFKPDGGSPILEGNRANRIEFGCDEPDKTFETRACITVSAEGDALGR